MRTAGATIAGGALFVAAPAAAQQLSPKQVGSIHSEAIRFEPFEAFPPGAELAKVVADPTKPGPYVVRVKVASGVKLLPHIHPEDRVYTVISGVFYIGFGSVFDPTKLQAYGPGSVVILPGNTPHFHAVGCVERRQLTACCRSAPGSDSVKADVPHLISE